MLGHIFPIWLGFRGGKGVATSLGVLLAVAWPVGVFACVTWLAMAIAFRISSLSALTALALAPVAAYLSAGPAVTALAVFIAVLVFFRHDANIRRLLKGEEPRMRLGGKA